MLLATDTVECIVFELLPKHGGMSFFLFFFHEKDVLSFFMAMSSCWVAVILGKSLPRGCAVCYFHFWVLDSYINVNCQWTFNCSHYLVLLSKFLIGVFFSPSFFPVPSRCPTPHSSLWSCIPACMVYLCEHVTPYSLLLLHNTEELTELLTWETVLGNLWLALLRTCTWNMAKIFTYSYPMKDLKMTTKIIFLVDIIGFVNYFTIAKHLKLKRSFVSQL